MTWRLENRAVPTIRREAKATSRRWSAGHPGRRCRVLAGAFVMAFVMPFSHPPAKGFTISTSSPGDRAAAGQSPRRTTAPLTATARPRRAGSSPLGAQQIAHGRRRQAGRVLTVDPDRRAPSPASRSSRPHAVPGGACPAGEARQSEGPRRPPAVRPLELGLADRPPLSPVPVEFRCGDGRSPEEARPAGVGPEDRGIVTAGRPKADPHFLEWPGPRSPESPAKPPPAERRPRRRSASSSKPFSSTVAPMMRLPVVARHEVDAPAPRGHGESSGACGHPWQARGPGP